MPRRQPFARRWRASARVSTPAMAGMLVVAQERRQLAGVVEHGGRGVGDDQCPQPRPDRLVVVGEPTVVADQRIGHDHDLAGVRGVGADLLVAGLARVDDEVAAGRDRRPERDAREDGPVLERQQRRTEVADPGIDDRARPGRRRHGRAITRPRIQRTHRPRGLGGRTRARTSMPPSPASRDRYASLTGPAMKGRAQGSTWGPGPVTQEPRPRPIGAPAGR